MKRTCVCVAGLFSVLALAFVFTGYGCGSDSSSADGGGGDGDAGGGGAAPTAQELQDAVAIDGAAKKTGDLPQGSSDPGAPQVTDVIVPDSVGPGKAFQVTVSFHTGTSALAKLLVKIDGASGYFELAASAVPDTDGKVSFPMVFEEDKLASTGGGLSLKKSALTAASARGLGGTKLVLIVQLVDADGTAGESKQSDMDFSGSSGACTGEGCGGGGSDGGVDGGTDACEGKNIADPCVLDGETEVNGICYLETFISLQSYTLTCYKPCDSTAMYDSCDTGKKCYPGWVPLTDGGWSIVYVCAPEGTTKAGDACTMFNECENGTQCFGMSPDGMNCQPTCMLDGGVCADPINEQCDDIFKQGTWGVCTPKTS